MSQSLDEILKSINTSLISTNDAVSNLNSKVQNPELPDLVQDLLEKTKQTLPEGVSLLDVKNNAMLSYINNLALIILARIEAVKTNNSEKVDKLKESGVKGTIVQRVVMERGIKNLEKKLSYQLEKMVRNYKKMEKDSSEETVTKKFEAEQENNSDDSEEEDDEEEDSDSEDDLNFRPDASALFKDMKTSSKSTSKKSSSEDAKPSTEKYRPPKIAAALPPSEIREKSTKTRRNGNKLQAMEEYLAETGDAPLTEQSIGSNILNNGRGGVQTERDRKKEEEVKRYEESNFTRLSTNMSKKDKAKKRKQDNDTFFGEDWGIFNNNRNDMNTSRSKPKSAWERAKKRRT